MKGRLYERGAGKVKLIAEPRNSKIIRRRKKWKN